MQRFCTVMWSDQSISTSLLICINLIKNSFFIEFSQWFFLFLNIIFQIQINCLLNTEIFFFADSSALSSLSIQESSDIESRKSRKHTTLKTWDYTHLLQNSESEYKRKDWIFYCKYCENSTYECQNTLIFWNYFFKQHNIDIQFKSCKIEISSFLKLQDLYDKTAHSN